MFKNVVLYLFVSNALLWITRLDVTLSQFVSLFLYKYNTFIVLFGMA